MSNKTTFTNFNNFNVSLNSTNGTTVNNPAVLGLPNLNGIVITGNVTLLDNKILFDFDSNITSAYLPVNITTRFTLTTPIGSHFNSIHPFFHINDYLFYFKYEIKGYPAYNNFTEEFNANAYANQNFDSGYTNYGLPNYLQISPPISITNSYNNYRNTFYFEINFEITNLTQDGYSNAFGFEFYTNSNPLPTINISQNISTTIYPESFDIYVDVINSNIDDPTIPSGNIDFSYIKNGISYLPASKTLTNGNLTYITGSEIAAYLDNNTIYINYMGDNFFGRTSAVLIHEVIPKNATIIITGIDKNYDGNTTIQYTTELIGNIETDIVTPNIIDVNTITPNIKEYSSYNINLSNGIYENATTTIDKYLLIGGGIDANALDSVQIWNSNTDLWVSTNLSQARHNLIATSVDKYALFAGGIAYDNDNNFFISNVVDIWNHETNTWTSNVLSEPRTYLSATSVGQYALFAGGFNNGFSNIVNIWNSQNDSWTSATLSEPRQYLAATSVGNYALFAGGENNFIKSGTIDIWDSQNNIWTSNTLSEPRQNLSAISIGNYALFAGGFNNTGVSNKVDIWDSLNDIWTTANLSVGRARLTAAKLGKYALFAGGYIDNQIFSNVVDIWDSENNSWSTSQLSSERQLLTSGSVGKYAVFIGGQNQDLSYSSAIDFFVLGNDLNIILGEPPLIGNGYDNYNVNAHDPFIVKITPLPINATYTVENKIYDGNTNAQFIEGNSTVTNKVNNDDIILNVTNPTFDNKNIGISKTVTGTYSISGNDSYNYTLTNSTVRGNGNIYAETLTAEFTANNKIYDGTTNATILTTNLIGNISEPQNVALNIYANFASKNVADNITVSGTKIGSGLSGIDSDNYLLTTIADTTANITPKQLTASFTAANKYFDFNANAQVTGNTIYSVISGDSVTFGVTKAVFDSNVSGIGKTVTAAEYSLTGGDIGNYLFALANIATTTANITYQSNLTLTTSANTITYGDNLTITSTVTKLDSIINDIDRIDRLTPITFPHINYHTLNYAISIGRYAFFVDNPNSSNSLNYMDIWDSETQSWLTSYTTNIQYRVNFKITSVGKYALFGGGGSSSTSTVSDVVDIWDSETNYWTTTNLSQARYSLAATSVGKYALFGGGEKTGFGYSNVVDIWDSETQSWLTPTNLSQARYALSATSVGKYALFGGGFYDLGHSSVVDIWDSETQSWLTPTNLSQARMHLFATSVGKYALFAGGSHNNGFSSVVNIWNSETQQWLPATNLTQARYGLAATSVGKYALFGGGWNTLNSVDIVNIWNSETNTWTTTTLSQARSYLSAISVGKYALFGGGFTDSGSSRVVDIFYNFIDDSITNPITAGNIEFYANSDLIGTKLVSNSVANITVSNLTVFSKIITTKYTGNLINSNADSNSVNLTINQRHIISTFTANTKQYDGTTNAILLVNNGISNKVGNDDITLNITNLNFDNKNIGTNKTVTGSYSLTGNSTLNYTINSANIIGSGNITHRPLTIGVTVNNKVYDGNTNIVITGNTVNKIGNDIVYPNVIAYFLNPNAGTNKQINLSLGTPQFLGDDSSNYQFGSFTPITANITHKPMYGKIIVANKVYDATTNATIIGNIFYGNIDGDIITPNISAAFVDKNVAMVSHTTYTLPVGRYDIAAISIGKYALFAGGMEEFGYQSYLDIWNSETQTWTHTNLPNEFGDKLVATTAGEYVLFTDGFTIIDIWNSKTDSWFTRNISFPRFNIFAISVGKYALFAGGNDVNSQPLDIIEVWNSETTDWETPIYLNSPMSSLATTSVGKYALFAGSIVNIWDSEKYEWLPNPGDLSVPRNLLAATSVGKYAIFAGGQDIINSSISNAVDIWNSETQTWMTGIPPLPVARMNLTATTIGKYALFAGGYTNSLTYSNRIDIFDSETLLWLPPLTLSASIELGSSTSVAEFVLFAGGRYIDGVWIQPVSIVDIFNFGQLVTPILGTPALLGTNAENYILQPIANTVAQITPRSLTIGVTVNNKVYDGNTDIVITGNTITNNIVGENEIYPNIIAAFSDKNANVNIPVDLSLGTPALLGDDSNNYQFGSFISITANITHKPMYGKIIVANKVYDATTNATIISNIFYGNIDGDIITPNISAAFIDKNTALINKSVIALSKPRSYLTATSVEKYALFAGGWSGDSNYSANVDIWDSEIKSWSFNNLSTPRSDLTATSVGKYALFAGGTDGNNFFANIDIWNSENNSWSTASLSEPKAYLAATSVGKYALFAGGWSGGSNYIANVDIWDSENNSWNIATLSTPRSDLVATSVGKYALFAGGTDDNNFFANIDIWNSENNSWSTASLSEPKAYLAATSVGKYALFAGGWGGDSNFYATVNIWDSENNSWNVAILTTPRSDLVATSVGKYALFAGGGNNNGFSIDINIWDSENNSWSTASLSEPKAYLAATSIREYTYFAGGMNATTIYSFIDVFDFGKLVTPILGTPALLGTNATNYILQPIANTVAQITPKPLTIGVTVNNKVYDSNTDIVITGNTVNKIGNDIVYPNIIAAFSDKNANVNIPINLSLGSPQFVGSDSSNYQFGSFESVTANITLLGITGSFTANNKVYDGTRIASVLTKTLNGIIVGDDIDLNITANFTSKNVSINQTVVATKIDSGLIGADSINYSLGIVSNTTANITAKPLYGIFTVADKVYDASNIATVTSNSIVGNISGENITFVVNIANFNTRMPGTGIIVTPLNYRFNAINIPNLSNYILTANTTTANITQISSLVLNNDNFDEFLADGISANIELEDNIYFNNILPGKLKVTTGSIIDGNNKNFILSNIANYEGALEMLGGTIKNIYFKIYDCSLKENSGILVSNITNKAEGVIDGLNVITGGVNMGDNCGGFVGTNAGNLIIQNSYYYGKISGNNSGGILGSNNGINGGNLSIINCMVIGELANESGAILGNNNIVHTISDTFYVGQANNNNSFEANNSVNSVGTKNNVNYYRK